MVARRIRAFDIAELALETEIDDLADVFGFQLLGIDFGVFFFRAVVIDGIEQLGKTAAKLDAEAAIGTHAKYAFGL